MGDRVEELSGELNTLPDSGGGGGGGERVGWGEEAAVSGRARGWLAHRCGWWCVGALVLLVLGDCCWVKVMVVVVVTVWV